MKSYKWLANAFSHRSPGLFDIKNCKELKKLIKLYNKWAVLPLDQNTEQQICKDIVRTFPSNMYFERNNSGYYSMYKVLAAYSNLDEITNRQSKNLKSFHDSGESQNSCRKFIEDSPRIPDRKAYRTRWNKILRNELIDSFCELSFEDSTQYVQGMNFIVGMLCYHLSPELAFCLFVKLMKDYDLEDNYTPGLKGFKMKSDRLNLHVQKYLPSLHSFFVSTPIVTLIGIKNDIHWDVHCWVDNGTMR